jgi:hypothetical protein
MPDVRKKRYKKIKKNLSFHLVFVFVTMGLTFCANLPFAPTVAESRSIGTEEDEVGVKGGDEIFEVV